MALESPEFMCHPRLCRACQSCGALLGLVFSSYMVVMRGSAAVIKHGML